MPVLPWLLILSLWHRDPISATFLVLTLVLIVVLAAPMIRRSREEVFREGAG